MFNILRHLIPDEITDENSKLTNGRYLLNREIIIVDTSWKFNEMIRLIKQ